jgi:hypothetical protein
LRRRELLAVSAAARGVTVAGLLGWRARPGWWCPAVRVGAVEVVVWWVRLGVGSTGGDLGE